MKINFKPTFLKSGRTPEWFRVAYPTVIKSLAAGKSFEEIHTDLISTNPKVMRTRNGLLTLGNLTNMVMRYIRDRQIPDFSHLKGFRNRVYVDKISRAYTPTSTLPTEETVTPVFPDDLNVPVPKDVTLHYGKPGGGKTKVVGKAFVEAQIQTIAEVIQSNLSAETKLRYIRRELGV